MNIVAELTMRALSAASEDLLNRYGSALAAACDGSPPPFGTATYGERFRELAVNDTWTAAALVTNAEREAEGAGRLWNLAASTSDPEIATCVKKHAIDEARHSRWYVTIVDLVFPGAIQDGLRIHVEGLSPRYSAALVPTSDPLSPFAHSVTLDDLVQMNIAEIRTAVNQQLQRPMLMAHCPEENQPKLSRLLDGLYQDEVQHILYSARLVERFAQAGRDEEVHELMAQRLADFNEITCEEVEMGVFPLHCSNQKCRLSSAPKCARRASLGDLAGEPTEARDVVHDR